MWGDRAGVKGRGGLQNTGISRDVGWRCVGDVVMEVCERCGDGGRMREKIGGGEILNREKKERVRTYSWQ
jgi:hypothetical protein